MKKLNFLAICFTAMCSLTYAQTYQNTTPTAGAATETRSSGCGSGVQPGVQMSNITVPIAGTITHPDKVTIEMGISAAWAGDVAIDLIAPSGDAITLIRRIGASSNTACGNSGDFVAANLLTFNSVNTAPINLTGISGTIPIPGGFYAPSYGTAKYPAYFPVTMNTFLMGQSVAGVWRLIIYDYGTGDEALIDNWKISFAPGVFLKTNEGGVVTESIVLQENPVGDYLRIDVKNDFKNLVFNIYDASGKMVKSESASKSNNGVQLDVRTLSPGMYLLVPTKDGERQQSIKFIKK